MKLYEVYFKGEEHEGVVLVVAPNARVALKLGRPLLYEWGDGGTWEDIQNSRVAWIRRAKVPADAVAKAYDHIAPDWVREHWCEGGLSTDCDCVQCRSIVVCECGDEFAVNPPPATRAETEEAAGAAGWEWDDENCWWWCADCVTKQRTRAAAGGQPD